MEASEKPQLPLDGASTAPDGVVRALDDRLVIERLTVTDDRAARVVRERAEAGQEAVRTVQDAIEIGARVLDREAAAAEVDYVRAEFERHAADLREHLTRAHEAGQALLAEQIVEAFDGDDSVQAQVREIVAAGTQQQTQDLIKLLTTEDGSNPLVAVQTRLGKAMLEAEERHRKEVELLREGHTKEARSMHGQVAELRKELARVLERDDADTRVADAEDAGTRKGFTFEERVHEALAGIAAVRGDVASHTGAETAEGGGKKGDT